MHTKPIFMLVFGALGFVAGIREVIADCLQSSFDGPIPLKSRVPAPNGGSVC